MTGLDMEEFWENAMNVVDAQPSPELSYVVAVHALLEAAFIQAAEAQRLHALVHLPTLVPGLIDGTYELEKAGCGRLVLRTVRDS